MTSTEKARVLLTQELRDEDHDDLWTLQLRQLSLGANLGAMEPVHRDGGWESMEHPDVVPNKFTMNSHLVISTFLGLRVIHFVANLASSPYHFPFSFRIRILLDRGMLGDCTSNFSSRGFPPVSIVAYLEVYPECGFEHRGLKRLMVS